LSQRNLKMSIQVSTVSTEVELKVMPGRAAIFPGAARLFLRLEDCGLLCFS